MTTSSRRPGVVLYAWGLRRAARAIGWDVVRNEGAVPIRTSARVAATLACLNLAVQKIQPTAVVVRHRSRLGRVLESPLTFSLAVALGFLGVVSPVIGDTGSIPAAIVVVGLALLPRAAGVTGA